MNLINGIQNKIKIEYNVKGIYAVPEAKTLKININLNRVLHIYLVIGSKIYGL